MTLTVPLNLHLKKHNHSTKNEMEFQLPHQAKEITYQQV